MVERLAKKVLLIGVVLLFFALSGCVITGNDAYRRDIIQNMQYKPYTPTYNLQSEGNCACFVCTKNEELFGVRSNLMGATCFADLDCTEEDIKDYLDPSTEKDLKTFMVGQGPTIADFSLALPYCAYGMDMAVQWLPGSDHTPYPLPAPERAMCLLSAETIPVYILYSNSTNINASRAREIGNMLGQEGGESFFKGLWSKDRVGPNIIVAEIDFDKNKVDEVVEEIIAIDQGCGNIRGSSNEEINCLVAVAPKIGDMESLEEVMRRVGTRVDIIAVGVNGRYIPMCENGVINAYKMMDYVLNYTAAVQYKYKKPILIPYILFDKGEESADGCRISESDLVALYEAFWPYGIMALQQNGVIGIAAYAFNSTSASYYANPLKCKDCRLGKTKERMNAWFGWCAKTYLIKSKGAEIAGGRSFLIYPTTPYKKCDFGINTGFLGSLPFESGLGKDLLAPSTPEAKFYAPPGEENVRIFSCAACAVYDSSWDISKFSPYLAREIGAKYDAESEVCTAFEEEIERWASVNEIDPMLLRAFVKVESNFNPCAVAKVCKNPDDASDCYPTSACYPKAYPFMEDPSGRCSIENAPDYDSERPQWKWCGMGLTQSLEPPYTFWPQSIAQDLNLPSEYEYGKYAEYYERANFAALDKRVHRVAEFCGPDFNPFDPEDSLCAGSTILKKNLDTAERIVQRYRSGFPWSDPQNDEMMKIFIAGWLYAGHWYTKAGGICGGREMGECFMQEFTDRQEVDEEYCRVAYERGAGLVATGCEKVGNTARPKACYGIKDPIKFFRECIQEDVPSLRGRFTSRLNPAEKRLVEFIKMQNCRSNLCPPDKNIKEKLCEEAPDLELCKKDASYSSGPTNPPKD